MQHPIYIELKEAALLCQLNELEINELLEYSAITLTTNESNVVCIASDCIDTLQKAAQIRRDFALDLFTMAILMKYIKKIKDLETANLQLLNRECKCMR